MGQLRDQMERDCTLANFSPQTIKKYLGSCRQFAAHFHRSPAEMGTEEVKQYLQYGLTERQYSSSTYRTVLGALKFLYRTTLGRPLEVERLRFPRKERRLPVVLSGTEVEALFAATRSLRHRTIFQVLYATGLRISEVLRLEVSDIDSKRGLIRIRQGKGKKDRYVPLSPRLLEALRAYWRATRPAGPLLFPGRVPGAPVFRTSVRAALRKAARDAGISKPVTPHTLRHTFATHLLELGVEAVVVQKILGHADARTTQLYLQVSGRLIKQAGSPLDLLGTPDGALLG